MTERLYYTDQARLEFEATVLACETIDGRLLAILDRTAFYPTSGGQPHDTGTLDELAVTDVVDLEDGRIGHAVSGALEPGRRVRGRIDAARRRDHMQQHTGQHILSAAFDRLCSARTVGFHLGGELSTIDLDKVLTAESIAKAEAEANRLVWEDRPVTMRVASAEDAAALPLRKEATRTGPLRLIEVEGFDLSACGGTHVARTGEVGLVALRAWEKFRGGLRLEFVCGLRALREFRTLRDAVIGSQRFLSVAPLELPSAIERAQVENKDLRKTIKDLQDRVAQHEAAALVARAPLTGGVRIVVESLDGWDQAGLKSMAAAAAAQGSVVAAMTSAAQPALVVIARSSDVALDASAVLKALVGVFGGKGGGRPELAQGGGLAATPEALRDEIRRQLAQALPPAP